MQFLPGNSGLSSSPHPFLTGDNATSLYAHGEFRIYQDAIERLKNNEDQFPSLPKLTLDIRRAMSNPDISQQELAQLIARDPGLTAILMKHASSALYRSIEKPKNLKDVISRLGMNAVDSVVLAHSLKSLFVMKNPNLKQLFKRSWRRQTLKACISYYLAQRTQCASPDDALVASLLSEVGTLAMLVALQNYDVPAEKTYQILCRHYSKHLGAVLLARWGLDRQFSDILRLTGEWQLQLGHSLHLADIVNLGLYHAIHHLEPENDLMPIEHLVAYQKLPSAFHSLTESNTLWIVQEDWDAIEAMASTFV